MTGRAAACGGEGCCLAREGSDRCQEGPRPVSGRAVACDEEGGGLGEEDGGQGQGRSRLGRGERQIVVGWVVIGLFCDDAPLLRMGAVLRCRTRSCVLSVGNQKYQSFWQSRIF